MLTRVDVQSESPFYLKIRDARPTDSIIVQKIVGLDPPNIDVFLGDYARDGGFYSGRRVPLRNPVLTLSLNPNYKLNESVSGLRKLLYRAFIDPFDGSDSVTLVLKDDEIADRYVIGSTEKFESDIFSDDPTVVISMLCPNPYLLDVAQTVLTGVGPQLTFSYLGSAETGFEVSTVLTSATSVLKIDLNGHTMTVNYDFVSDDIFYMNTTRGSRQLKVTRTVAGVTTVTDLLFALASTNWLEIHALTNLIQVYGATSDILIANVSNLTFRASHWGI